MSASLEALISDNRTAVDLLIAAAMTIPIREWTTPLAPDKWSPAQHVHHVALAYAATVHDVRDGVPARLIGSAGQRLMWRAFGLTQILWLGKLPTGARSPREFRPPDASPVRAALLAELRDHVADFESALRSASSGRRDHRVVHPYFGTISLRQAIVVCAVHTRHHTSAITRPRTTG